MKGYKVQRAAKLLNRSAPSNSPFFYGKQKGYPRMKGYTVQRAAKLLSRAAPSNLPFFYGKQKGTKNEGIDGLACCQVAQLSSSFELAHLLWEAKQVPMHEGIHVQESHKWNQGSLHEEKFFYYQLYARIRRYQYIPVSFVLVFSRYIGWVLGRIQEQFFFFREGIVFFSLGRREENNCIFQVVR